MIDKERLDKLLNAYIDGELGQREQTEVKRLVKHDEHIAAQLQEIVKCRDLVNAMPVEEAPAGIIDGIKERIESQVRPPISYQEYDRAEGAKQLMHRKILAMAAMFALAAVLGVVVYTIIAPDKGGEVPTIAELQSKPQPPTEIPTDTTIVAAERTDEEPVETAAIEPVETAAIEPVAPARQIFTATLELSTVNERQVNAFIQRAIADNDMLQQQSLFAAQQDGIYAISGSKEGLSMLLADLASAWNQFESASLYVETEKPGQKVIVSGVTPQQIDKIAAKQDNDAIVATAKDFAALNRISTSLGTDELVAAMPAEELELMPIPKPALTSSRTEPKTMLDPLKQQFSLTIVINGAD